MKPSKSLYNHRMYKIVYAKDLIEDHNAYGMTKHFTRQIDIATELEGLELADTLVHEVMHQLFSDSGMDFPDKKEEQVCTYFGRALTAHMRDNPEFWAFVTKESQA